MALINTVSLMHSTLFPLCACITFQSCNLVVLCQLNSYMSFVKVGMQKVKRKRKYPLIFAISYFDHFIISSISFDLTSTFAKCEWTLS